MFHSAYLYPPQQYPNLAALAEARAAEAAEKAKEAEYLAYQAALQEENSRFSSPSPFWFQSAPAHRAAHSCSCVYTPQAPAFSAYSQAPLGLPAASSHGRPLFPHHFGSRHSHSPHVYHGIPVAHPQSCSVEELKARLREETIARYRAEQELRRKQEELAIRQRQLAALADSKTYGTRSSHRWSLSGPQAPSHDGALQQEPQPFPPKRASTRRADDADFIRVLLSSLLGASTPMKSHTPEPIRPKKVEEAPKPNSSSRIQKQSHEGSLIEQLKARYAEDGEDEIRDTIQAIINSLSDAETPRKQDINVAAGTSRSTLGSRSNVPSAEFVRVAINSLSSKPSTGTNSQTNASAPSSTKGKEKEIASLSESTSIDLKAALERVESIENTFHHLEAEFDFPSQLDFVIQPERLGADTSSVFPHLAFTARNHPVRYYEQTLTTLLNQLDLIESHGDATLRRRRKDAVGSIEKALDDLEREVAALWKAKVDEGQSATRNQESTTTTLSSEEETSAIITPQPVRIPIVDLESTAISNPKNAEGEEGSADLVASNAVSDQLDGGSNTDQTPSTEETHGEESSPISTLAESASDPINESSDEDGHESTIFGREDTLSHPREEQEVVHKPDVLDAFEESPQEDSGVPVPAVDETPSMEDLNPLPEPSILRATQQGDNDGNSYDDSSAEDAFLLAPPESPTAKPKAAHPQQASVEEDLGSDWSDLDA